MCISAPSGPHSCTQQVSGHLGSCHLDHVKMSEVPSRGKQVLHFQTPMRLLRRAYAQWLMAQERLPLL